MPYGIIKVDTITFTDGGADKTISISGLVQNPTFSGNITVTGTVSGNVIQGGTTVSGATVTGTAGQFGTLTGNTAGFTTITGATVTGTVAQFTTITGGTAGFTTVTGATVTGTTANFTTLSGTTVTGNTGSFTTVTGGVATITSGVFAVGAEALPSISFASDPNTGIYSPGADQVAISTGGSGRLFVDASGRVGVGTSTLSALLHIGGTTAPTLKIEDTDNGFAPLEISATNGGRDFTLTTNQDYYFNNATTTYMTIQSSGNVGVGTSSPGVILDIRETATGATTAISLFNTDNTNSTSQTARIGLSPDSRGAALTGLEAYKENSDFSTSAARDVSLALNVLLNNAKSEAVRITSAGNVGIGTSSVSASLHISTGSSGSSPSAGYNELLIEGGNEDVGMCFLTPAANNRKQIISFGDSNNNNVGQIQYDHSSDSLSVKTNNSTALTIDSSQRLGIGTTPSTLLHIQSTDPSFRFKRSDAPTDAYGEITSDTVGLVTIKCDPANAGAGSGLAVTVDNTERARIDSSGRLLVGTSSSRTAISSSFPSLVQVETSAYSAYQAINNTNDTTGAWLALGKSRGTSAGGVTVVQNNDELGYIGFVGADGTDVNSIAAAITAQVDGTPGNNDMPGRLVFSTTADGASSPTEAMRINKDGSVLIQTTAIDSTVAGSFFNSGTDSNFHQVLVHTTSTSSIANLYLNRQASDGTLIEFRQADITEGTISVSGTTVTYGGGHIARWSQLPNDEDPSTLLKGTVMSNLDEMCEWGEEDNEQLNKTKVSDVEGDPNVAGVFVAASPSEDGPLDFFVGMTGDMIIRIAAGVTVERGDLLMSAGDGTAKPQDDDIIRSKTIAKVTSTNVSCTYDDGSYCVPCVLMAC